MSVAENGVKRKRTAIIVSIVAVVLSLIIAIYLIVGLLLLGVGGVIIVIAASSTSDVDKGYRYDTTELNGGCAITYAFGNGDAIIPDEIDGLKVLVICEEAFMNDEYLTSDQNLQAIYFIWDNSITIAKSIGNSTTTI